MKMVIRETLFGWDVTSVKNYESYIQDASKIFRFSSKCNYTLEDIKEIVRVNFHDNDPIIIRPY